MKIGRVELGKVGRVVASITSLKKHIINKAKAAGADILELRIDCLPNLKNIDAIIAQVKSINSSHQKQRIPLIATVRAKKEGGRKALSNKQRLDLYKILIPLVEAIDIELNAKEIKKEVLELAHGQKKIVIFSWHNFRKTPVVSIIEKKIIQAKKEGADIVKIACMAKTEKDILRLAQVTDKHRKKNIITISLGKRGSISRKFFPHLGSLLTYGHIGDALAPGQLSLSELKKLC